jgi:ribonuclease-3
MKKKILDLQNSIKIKFTNLDLLKQSLIHKSYDKNFNNEKLEFLGDRVLGLVLSKKLLEIYPNEKEGIIDKKFANLVNKKVCAVIAKSINIIEYMSLGSSFKAAQRSDQKINSDCLEALIGAIFLDKGLDVSEKIILNLWKEYLKKSNLTQIDSKTRLQEFSLKKYKKLPEYKIFKQTGPQHNPTFKVDVKISNSKKFTGTGNSKKDAQQNAAKKLLIDLNV